MGIGAGSGSKACDVFLHELGQLTAPRVLELGTLQSEPGRSTHHAAWLPEGSTHVKSDIEAGPDVDVVADAHDLESVFGREAFDVLIAVSVWEHLERPWIAARELHAIMYEGAIAYICTHQTFPIHAYPSDFFRFSDDGLAALFDWAGFEVLAKSYAYPCTIVPPPEITVWNPAAPAFLNVDVCVRAR